MATTVNEPVTMPPVLTQEAQTVAIVAAILMSNQRVTDEDVAVEDAKRIVQKASGGGSGYFVHSG
jgi:hypothetical protein